MKKALMIFALCAMCGSAFAGAAVTDWGIFTFDKEIGWIIPTHYDGLMEDSGIAGFTVHANPEAWVGSDRPVAGFLSENVSPGLIIDTKTLSFQVSVTGFDDLLKYWVNITDHSDIQSVESISLENRGKISVGFYNDDPDYITVYTTDWKGDGIYTFGRKQYNGGGSAAFRNPFEVTSIGVVFQVPQHSFNGYENAGYYLGDNTTGTVELFLPEPEVPEPSSLLALAFGGAGTALAVRRRK